MTRCIVLPLVHVFQSSYSVFVFKHACISRGNVDCIVLRFWLLLYTTAPCFSLTHNCWSPQKHLFTYFFSFQECNLSFPSLFLSCAAWWLSIVMQAETKSSPGTIFRFSEISFQRIFWIFPSGRTAYPAVKFAESSQFFFFVSQFLSSPPRPPLPCFNFKILGGGFITSFQKQDGECVDVFKCLFIFLLQEPLSRFPQS